MNRIILIIIALFLIVDLHESNAQDAGSIIGTWKTIDDNSGKPRSHVEIYKKGDKYFGKVVKTYPKPGEPDDPICDLCPGERKNKKVIGMEIIKGMVYDDGEYVDGEILDPDNGKVYRCKLWLEDGILQVRGYVAFFFRTQEWLPLD